MTIQQLFEQFVIEYQVEFKYGFAPNSEIRTATFYITGDNAQFETICFFMEEEDILLVLIDLRLDEDKINLENINHLNGLIKFGSYIYNELDEKVFVRNTQILRGEDEIKYNLLKETILMTGIIANQGIAEFS